MTPADLDKQEIARLRAQVEELTADLSEARGEVRRQADQDFCARVLPGHFGITGRAAVFLYELWRARRLVSHGVLIDLVCVNPSDPLKLLQVYAYKVRLALGDDSILTVWGNGYLLSEKGLAKVDDIRRRYDAGELQSVVKGTTATPRRERALAEYREAGGV